MPLGAQDFQKGAQGMKFTTQSMEVEVEFYSPSIVRVYKVPEGNPYEKKSLVVIKSPEKTDVKTETEGDSVVMESSKLRVVVHPSTGGIVYYSRDGKELLRDKDYGTSFSEKEEGGKPSYEVRGTFLLEKGEPIYGLGQVMDGKLNRRNSSYHMQNENMFTYSPYFLSAVKGYGVYWDNYSISEFRDTPQDLSFESTGRCADYYFLYGGDADGVIGEVRTLTGHAPMLPLWAYGFFQSKERYHTQEESLEVLRKYRKLKIPIDCMIQDWRYWPEYEGTDSAWNSQRFDKARFPDPKKWVEEIHRLKGKLMIVTWPGFGPKTEQYKELESKGMLIGFHTWPPKSGALPYDVYNPEARDIYWKYLDRGIYSYIKNDGWWLDSTEPDHIDRKGSDYELPTYLGTYGSVKNAFSLMHNSGISTHQKAEEKDKRVVILTRSGFIGQQRYGSTTWSGDVSSTWEMLEKQIPAALNFTLMGLPNWNSDIGGFFAGIWNKGGGAKNPGYQELYVRWMQFGTFCPMMRSHGTDIAREIWNFGNRGEWSFDAQEKMIDLRYRLLPYIYSTSWDVSHNDGTFMRALVMDYASDRKTYDLGGEYLFGRSLLVSPVTRPGVKEWPVYLPEGQWWDFWSNEKIRGGQKVSRTVSKDILPVYVKGGSIVPFGPAVQYSTEKRWEDLEIRIYGGGDGQFGLYEDENDNYGYESGRSSLILFRWEDAKRRLTIEDRRGEFPGMLKRRKFKLVLVGRKSGVGDQAMKGNKTVSYTGAKMVVKL